MPAIPRRFASAATLLVASASLALLLVPATAVAEPLGIASAQLATGLPDAVIVPGYGIGYSTGAYPPPSDVTGPFGARFPEEGAAYGPVVVSQPPYDPSPTSIYGVSSPPGQRCSEVRGLAPGAPGVHWFASCAEATR